VRDYNPIVKESKMKDALLRAFAAKASTTPAKTSAPAAPSAPAATIVATMTRKWSDRDFPHPVGARVEAKVEARKSIHYKILSRTGK
jgi:hypothetical protein